MEYKKYEKLIRAEGTSQNVEFLFDQPKAVNTNWGERFLYGFKKDGEQYNFFATPYLNNKLSGFKRGDVVKIAHNKLPSGKTAWDVRTVAANKAKIGNDGIDARTHDIHKQVCLKLAVQMMGDINAVLSDSEVTIIKANTQLLLSVLEGDDESVLKGDNNKEDLPF